MDHTISQTELVARFIKKNGSITWRDAYRECNGCTRLPARMADLKVQGYKFESRRETDPETKKVFARYILLEAPNNG